MTAAYKSLLLLTNHHCSQMLLSNYSEFGNSGPEPREQLLPSASPDPKPDHEALYLYCRLPLHQRDCLPSFTILPVLLMACRLAL